MATKEELTKEIEEILTSEIPKLHDKLNKLDKKIREWCEEDRKMVKYTCWDCAKYDDTEVDKHICHFGGTHYIKDNSGCENIVYLECQQVIDNRTGERCGKKPARIRIGLGAILCDEHHEYVKKMCLRAWGIEEGVKE